MLSRVALTALPRAPCAQDNVPPFESETAVAIIESSLGKPVGQRWQHERLRAAALRWHASCGHCPASPSEAGWWARGR